MLSKLLKKEEGIFKKIVPEGRTDLGNGILSQTPEQILEYLDKKSIQNSSWVFLVGRGNIGKELVFKHIPVAKIDFDKKYRGIPIKVEDEGLLDVPNGPNGPILLEMLNKHIAVSREDVWRNMEEKGIIRQDFSSLIKMYQEPLLKTRAYPGSVVTRTVISQKIPKTSEQEIEQKKEIVQIAYVHSKGNVNGWSYYI